MSDEFVRILPYSVDLNKPVENTDLHELFVMGDSLAHRIELEITRGGAPVSLSSSTVTGFFTNFSEDTTIKVNGEVKNGKAAVTLSKPCYTLHGQFMLTIQITGGGVDASVFVGDGFMRQTKTETIIYDDYVIYDVSTMLAQIGAMKTATEAANTATGKANTAATNANNAASAANTAASGASGWANATMTATALAAGSAPTATVTTASDGHKAITVGIPRGNTGATPQISVQVETGAAGSEASVSVSGTAENPVIHLTIPRGNTGTIENLTINGKPVESGTITLNAWDVGALASDGIAADSSKLGGKTWAERLLDIYPIGSIYMSVNSTSPASLFGGTWEQLKDRFLLGAGSTYSAGSTGGAQNVTLTMRQIPQHTIKIREATSSGENTGYRFTATSGTYSMASYLETVGGGEPHNNMPPYLAVYMWKRVS